MSQAKHVRASNAAFLSILALVILALFLANVASVPAATAKSTVSLYYFYGADCPHCQEFTPVIDELEQEYPELDVHKREISYNETNSDLFNAFIQAYDPPAVDIPAVFIGDSVVIGLELSKERLEEEIEFCLQTECSDPLLLVQGQDGAEPEEQQSSLFLLLISTALIEGINPCGFAVLLVLLASLLMVKSKRSVLIVGLTFIASVFATHLAVGFGILEFYLVSGISPLLRTIVIAIVIPAGIINIMDFWREKSTLAIPSFVKPTLGKLVRYASVPAAVLLGFLATIAGLPCTGPIYLTMLDLIADIPSKTALYLVIYNLFYAVPLLVLLAIVYKESSSEEVEEWRKGKRKYMKLIGGVIMVAIGIAMLIGVI
ncbi:MAG TPA: cytochrome c biogenesis protein CcdA [Desulfobacteria bacterium]|nr:cytochrome c biogenesis protein CcdA [Desulfobacteria bacterium]